MRFCDKCNQPPLRVGFNTEEARGFLKTNAEAARLKAALLANPHTFLPTLDVLATDGRLTVGGTVHNPVEQQKIEDVARVSARTTAVNFELHYG